MYLIILASLWFNTSSWAGFKDNLRPVSPDICALLLAEKSGRIMTEEDGLVIFDSGRRKVSEKFAPILLAFAKAHLSKELAQMSSRERAELDELPSVALSSGGLIVEKHASRDDGVDLTLRSATDMSVIRSFQIKRSDWLGRIKTVGPGGDYIVVDNKWSTHIKIVSTRTGHVLIERETEDPEGIGATFSDATRLTMNTKGHLETYQLSEVGAPRLLFTHDLGSNPILLNEIGQVYYRPNEQDYVAFYSVLKPLLIKPGPNSTLTRRSFEPVTPDSEHSSYSPDGLISASGNLLIANRFQGFNSASLSMVDIFSISTRKHLRTIPLPRALTSAFALSPNERFLAVSANDNEGVRVYDLKKPSSTPYVAIHFPNQDGSLIAFASDHVLLAGSARFGELRRFVLPSPEAE